MSEEGDRLSDYIDELKVTRPACLDLLTARTEAEFETAFLRLLEHAVRQVEANAKNYRDLGEEGLTGALAGALSIPDVLLTVQEANSNGHVDLTLRGMCNPPRTKLGEAKIFSSASYHMKGMKQLLGRYTTGRETGGLLLNYVREQDIVAIIRKIRAALDKKRPESQVEPCADHDFRWSLRTKHRHKSGECVSLDHVGLNLYVE